MFANSQIQTRSRLAAAASNTNGIKKVDENKGSKLASKQLVSKSSALGMKKDTMVKKRSALGDVSNVQNNNEQERQGRVVLKPKRTTENIKKAVEAEKIVKKDVVKKAIPLPKPKVTKKTTVSSEKQEKEETELVSKVIKETRSRTKKLILEEEEEEIVQVDCHLAKKVKTQDWDDLDAEDGFDPCMVAEYVVEIFEYMKELEIQTLPNANYMDNQSELQWKMRTILVDWLIEVHSKFHLLPETLYLTINIIDRFLSLRVVSLVKLQLVGLTAMFIASKYEEVVSPSIQNFIYMADGGYTTEEVLKAERYVLQVLDFNLQYPSPMSFLRRCSKAENYDHQTRTLAKYLMEYSLVDYRFLAFPPSKVAAAGLLLSRKMLKRGSWDKNLTHYSGYAEEELSPVVDLVMDNLMKPTKYDAIFKKYSARKFMKASIFAKDWIEKHSPGSFGKDKEGNEESEEEEEDQEEDQEEEEEEEGEE